MRVGGLATGMDIEQMVNRLMDAERIPYRKMMQDRTTLTWKQDAFRDVNKSLLELDNLVLDMKLSKTYHLKRYPLLRNMQLQEFLQEILKMERIESR